MLKPMCLCTTFQSCNEPLRVEVKLHIQPLTVQYYDLLNVPLPFQGSFSNPTIETSTLSSQMVHDPYLKQSLKLPLI